MSAQKKFVHNSQNERSMGFFDLIHEDLSKRMYKCNISECGKIVNGSKNSNLVSHIKHVHPKIFGEKVNPVASEPQLIAIKRLELIQGCTEIVTVNGRPFNYLDDSGFKLLMQSKFKELADNGVPYDPKKNNYEEIKYGTSSNIY